MIVIKCKVCKLDIALYKQHLFTFTYIPLQVAKK